MCTSTNCFNFGSFFVSSSDLRLFIVVGFSPVVGHYCFCSKKKKKKKKKKKSGEVFQAASAVVSDGARLDIKASGFWASRHEVDFFDVRVQSTHLHRLTSINPSTKHTQTTNGRRCLRTERGWGESSTALWLPWCSPAREALAPQDPNSSRGWHQRSPTIGTCPTIKRWDGYAAECLSLFSAPQSFACVEAVGRNRVRRSSLRLLPPMLGLTSWAKWVELVVYLCPPPPPPPTSLF